MSMCPDLRLSRRASLALGAGVLLVLAFPAASRAAGCTGSQKPGGSQEGEIFGSVYENGQRTCANWGVSLVPHADAQSRLHMASYNPNLTARPIYLNMWEYWEPLTGFPCAAADLNLATYVASGSATSERIHAPSAAKEGHCVRPGRYTFSLGEWRSFDVDYIQPSGNSASNTLTGVAEAIEVTAYNPAINLWQDLVINVDFTSSHPGDTPVLDIQNAGASPYAGTFTNQASPTGTAADWFRFSVARSTSGWTVDNRGSALARLYFDGTDLQQATGYYDHKPEGIPVLRLRRFPNPTTAAKVYSVGLELLRPDEGPDHAPSVVRSVTITRINPDLAGSSLTIPASASRGQLITVTVGETNLGTNSFGPVEAGWAGKIYFSTDAVLSPATDTLVHSYTETQAIGAGQTVSSPRAFTVPASLAVGSYYVIASLDANGQVLESDEGNNVRVSATTLSVAGAPPTACATFEGTTTWKMTDQVFSAGCSTHGASIQYRWQTEAGGPWTAYSASDTYAFSGHPTAGNKQVTLEVKDLSSGLSATQAYLFVVQNSQLTISGPTYITVKQNYAYSSSTSATWYERFPPATSWGIGLGPTTSYTRTWSAGCYDVQLRADASGGGVLKRGRANVTVAIGSGCGGPL